MKELDWNRLVVVTASHGERFVGSIHEHVDLPVRYIEDCASAHKPVELHDVRVLVTQTRAITDPRGQPIGIQRAPMLLPLDIMNGPAGIYYILPSTWYFPGDSKEAKDNLSELIRRAEDMEARAAAEAAGIITSSSMPIKATH